MKNVKKISIISMGLLSLLASCVTNNPSTNSEENPSISNSITESSDNNSVESEIVNSEDASLSEKDSFESNISSGNLDSETSIKSDELSSEFGSNSSENSSISTSEEDQTSNEIVSGTTTESVNVVNYGGSLESAFAEFYPVKNASGYNAYYKLSTDSSWVQIDTELIRNYGDYYRVDALGLKEGSYKLKVTPIISSKEATTKGKIVDVNVKKHNRDGYAFVNGSSSGAYNDDGTLKSNAIVFYVTEQTKDTITLDVVTSSKGSKTTCVGMQNIIYGFKKQYDSRPVCFRLIGNITDLATMDKGDIVIDNNIQGLTIEGVGNDAVANGWGIRIKGSSNVEIRNIATMNCNSDEGDNIGLQQDNDHIWVHNCDFFYGDAGSDADQAKGDGALDTKKSTYVTHSYNHFWDTGKSNLQGMTSESTENYITYHHNWYDHSDSRHPRVRTCTVHVYNNYFDGVAKYGIGATLGSSVYVEGNYFRNTNLPMLISKQGSDIACDDDGSGTFSGEDGGIIKAYDNYMVGHEAFVTYQQNKTEFDAYLATSRDETVPTSVKSKQGGNTYSNFDTASSFYSYTYESPENAKETTMKYAGRVQGGDFKWTFKNATDDKSYDVNTSLKSALTSYKTSLISVGGNSIQGATNVDASEIIKMINDLPDKATLDRVDEIKSTYEAYLDFDKTQISNAEKIERLYVEALVLEVEHCKELIDLLDTSLTKTNIDNALNYYNSLSSSQQSELSSYKTKLDNKIKEYEGIASSEVVKLINALPNDITLDDENKINEAKSAYDALTSVQKEQVTNYSTLEAALTKLEILKNQKQADEFVAKVDALPSSKEELTSSDLGKIESLINEYNSLDNEVKKLIDTSYINKLNEYKEYINDNLISEVTVSCLLSDLSGNTGTTKNGFDYKTNGESGGYIKLKGDNYLSYDVETSSITMELVAKCLDSSEEKSFSITITYSDGTSEDFTFTTSSGKTDKTFIETFTGDITSIKVNGIEGKNLGVKSLTLTYNK